MLDATLDPTITDEMVAQAHAAAPIDYDQVFAAIVARGALAQDDDLDETTHPDTLTPSLVRGPIQAVLTARSFHDDNVAVGIGMCLRTVHRYFNVPALWPDAETAGEHSAPMHETTDPLAFPRGSVGYAYNERHGHVWINCGGGLCWTTDFRRLGFVDLAPVAAMAPWIGGHLVGWGEVLNGVDVWPDPKKPAPQPKPWGLADRELIVHRDLVNARANKAPKRRIDGLHTWDEHMLTRMAARGIDRLPL